MLFSFQWLLRSSREVAQNLMSTMQTSKGKRNQLYPQWLPHDFCCRCWSFAEKQSTGSRWPSSSCIFNVSKKLNKPKQAWSVMQRWNKFSSNHVAIKSNTSTVLSGKSTMLSSHCSNQRSREGSCFRASSWDQIPKNHLKIEHELERKQPPAVACRLLWFSPCQKKASGTAINVA